MLKLLIVFYYIHYNIFSYWDLKPYPLYEVLCVFLDNSACFGLVLRAQGYTHLFFREEFTKVLQWILMMIHIPTRWWLCRWQHLHHQCVTIITVGCGVRDHKLVVASTLEKELSECIENILGLFYEESLVEFGGLEFEGKNEQANFGRHY